MQRQQRFEETVATVARQSIRASEASQACFDVTVIGAGLAGALAARQLAQRGLSVLLVEKTTFPRYKVCGCCISPSAIQMLALAGLDGLLDDCGAVPVQQLQVASGNTRVNVTLERARSLSRKVLDLALVAAAVEAGVKFLPACSARVGQLTEQRVEVVLSESADLERSSTVWAKLVIVADGIGGTALHAHQEFGASIGSFSRIGSGTISMQAPEHFAPGTIFMACGQGGYLGLVRLEDDATDLAAAFDPIFLRELGSPALAASSLLRDCKWPVPQDIGDVHWQGTVPLTRRRRSIAATRVYVIGDAASYLEPFTGEGIGWALSSALSVVPLAVRAVSCWDESLIWRWEHTYAHLFRKRQLATRIASAVLRHHHLVSLAGGFFNSMPLAAASLARRISAPWNSEELEWLRS